MSPKEREYYSRHAAEERVCAAKASAVAAEIHVELAFLYEKLAKLHETEAPTLSIVTDRGTA